MTHAPSGPARSKTWLPPLVTTIVSGSLGGITGFLAKGPASGLGVELLPLLIASLSVAIGTVAIGATALATRRLARAWIALVLPVAFVVAALLAPIPAGGRIHVSGRGFAGTTTARDGVWAGPVACAWDNGAPFVEYVTIAVPSSAGLIVSLDPDGRAWVAESATSHSSLRVRIIDRNPDGSAGWALVQEISEELIISWRCDSGPGS